MIRSTLILFYGLTALVGFSHGFIATTYVNFLLSKGLNLFEVNMVNVVFFVMLFLCEIPTGAFADVFGRKRSFVISCIVNAIGLGLYAKASTFWQSAGAEAVLAVGMTFSNGAFQSWLVDELKHHGHDEPLKKIFGRASYLRALSMLVAAFIGAQIGNISLAAPFVIGAVMDFVTFIIGAILIKESYFVRKKVSIKHHLKEMMQTTTMSLRYCRQNVNVRFILVLVLVQVSCLKALDMQWSPFYRSQLSSQSGLGYIWIGITFSMIFGAWIASKQLKAGMNERKLLIVCQLLIGATMALAAVKPFALSLVVFYLHEGLRGLFNPVKEAYLQDNIPSKERATISSFSSLAHHLGGSIGLALSGYGALKLGMPVTWVISGIVLIFGTLTVTRKGKGSKARVPSPLAISTV